jgi:iron(II)-dependent oxidoreductase
MFPEARTARQGTAQDLGRALQASRRDTLATHAAYERALGAGLRVPQRAELNPPLWELGHIGWFQEYWIARNSELHRGSLADPTAHRTPPLREGADALYDSSNVPHATRWSLPLPDARATLGDLAGQLAQTLDHLARLAPDPESANDDAALYFHRLALLHEDMHHEAALYMAQALGIAIDDPRWQPPPLPAPAPGLSFDAAPWRLGLQDPVGFAFDNELGRLDLVTPAFRIDTQVQRWADFLPFVEADGYRERRWWSQAGWAWREANGALASRYLRREGGTWQQWRHGRWAELGRHEAACHLTLHEAEAWCAFAGRRLPTEAEWERAAFAQPEAFRWGDVWEWTASPFQPFSGFRPHPYRDYSTPWFDGRPVMRGASYMTQPRMKHARYRNFFQPHRNDVPAGFRTCDL